MSVGPIITLVAAVADNGVIGRGGGLPWHLPDDLRHFQRLTTGHTVIMGRRTFDEVRQPLRQRRNIVITRNPDFQAEGFEVARDLDEALALAAGESEVFVVGGGQIFADALAGADRMYLTHVHADVTGDIRFPVFDPRDWEVTWEERHERDARHAHSFTIRRYDRRRVTARALS